MMRFLVLLFLFLLATIARAAEPYVPSDAERARWTMSDMQSWKIVFEAYKVDYDAYPVAKSIEEARKAAEPVYINHAPMTDAWGHQYRIASDGKTFQVVSAGADGVFENDDDAIVSNKTRWPVLRAELK